MIAALALLAVLIVLSPSRMVFDEGHHMSLTRAVKSSGWIAGLTDKHIRPLPVPYTLRCIFWPHRSRASMRPPSAGSIFFAWWP